jgi:hypothetical protein
MTLWRTLAGQLSQTATRNAFAGYNSRGDPSFSTSATTFPVLVAGKQGLTKGPSGRDVLYRQEVYVGPSSTGGTPNFTVQDRVTLPDATTPPIVNVGTFPERSGVSFQVLYCG